MSDSTDLSESDHQQGLHDVLPSASVDLDDLMLMLCDTIEGASMDSQDGDSPCSTSVQQESDCNLTTYPGQLIAPTNLLQMLELLSKDSDMTKIVFEAFLKQAAALLSRLLLSKSEKDPETDIDFCIDSDIDQTDMSTDSQTGDNVFIDLQYTNIVLWKLFSGAFQIQQLFAECLCIGSKFTEMVFKLNLKAIRESCSTIRPVILLTNEVLPLVMLSLPLCDKIKVHLANSGYLMLVTKYLTKISTSDLMKMEGMVKMILLNLQIIYQCVSGVPVDSSLKNLCVQSLKPLLNTTVKPQIRLMSKAIITSLNPTEVNVDTVCTLSRDEIQTLFILFDNVVVESPCEDQISLINLLFIFWEFLKNQSNQKELASCHAEHILTELLQNVTDDLRPYVNELVESVSGKGCKKANSESCFITALSKDGASVNEDTPSFEKLDEEHDCLEIGDATFDVVDTILCQAVANNTSKIDALVAFLLAANLVSQSTDEVQTKVVEQLAETHYIKRVVNTVCQCLQRNSVEIPPDQRWFFVSVLVQLLMDWSHFSTLMCKELGKANVLEFLATILQVYKRSKAPEENEIEVLIHIFCTLLNFAYDPTNLPMFDSCNTVPLLLTFARCPHFEVALLSRIVLSFLTPLLNYDQLPALKLDEEESAYFVSTLQQAMQSSDQEAEGYSVIELLRIITRFIISCCGLPSSLKNSDVRLLMKVESDTERVVEIWQNSKHQHEMMKHSKAMEENGSNLVEADILSVLEDLLKASNEESIINNVAILLWNLLHHVPVRNRILKNHLPIVHSLRAYLNSSQSSIQQEVLCALILLGSIDESTELYLQYAEACYSHGHYKECIDICDLVMSKDNHGDSDNTINLKAKLLKGKSSFHVYQPALRVIMVNKQSLPKRELKQLLDGCIPQMKEAITILGELLEKKVLDDEGSKVLDLAMMDCLREANMLNKCRRCLLCRERKELCRSHVWSESVIKQVSEKKFGNKHAKNIMFGSDKKLLRSPGGVTYWMLCQKCEEILSQNGEKEYVNLFCGKVDMNEFELPYTSWLYNFAVGILFRTMSTLVMYDCLNSEEVYESFVLCRKYLLRLPVKMGCEFVPPTPLQEYQLDSFCTHTEQSLNPVVLITPPNMAGYIELNMDYFSERYIDDARIDSSGLVHFFMTYCNRTIILLQFEPSYSYKFPPAFEVQPTSGIYKVPSEDCLMAYIPNGIKAAFSDYQQFHLNSNLQISRNISSAAAEKVNRDLPQLKATMISEQLPNIEVSSEESDYDTEPVSMSEFSLGALKSVSACYLPFGFTVERTSQVKLNISDDHQILLHTHIENLQEDQNIQATSFVGVFSSSPNSGSKSKPYFVILQWDKENDFVRADGVLFSAELKVERYLLEQGKSHPLQFLRIPLPEFQELITHLVPLMLQQQGHNNIHALLHLANHNRVFHKQCGVLSVDFRCSPDGCWYCEDKCICCMKPAAPWSGGNSDAGGFCSRVCKQLFHGDPTVDMILTASGDMTETSIQILETVRPSGAYTNIVDSLHLCVEYEPCELHIHKKPFIIRQLRKADGQMFANCFLDEECCPCEMAWNSQFGIDEAPAIVLVESHADHIKSTVLSTLRERGYSDINSWVSHVSTSL